MTYKIVAIDGGGTRNVITALLLEKLDTHCGLVKNTDLFAGTASGSLFALALAQGINIAHIMSIFEQKGEYIFDPAPMDFNGPVPLNSEQQAALENAVLLAGNPQKETLKSLFQAQFRTDYIKQELTRLFGALRLSELPMSGPQVVVEAMQLWPDNQRGWAPVSIGSGRNDPFSEMQAMDAVLCACATPVYFPPHKPEEPANKNWGYFSGGNIYASNPSLAAVHYASEHFDAQVDDCKVLSLGAGKMVAGIPPQDVGRAECWGGWQWIRQYSQHGGTVPGVALVEAAVTAATMQCDAQAKLFLRDNYIRADFDLPAAYSGYDWDQFEPLAEATEQYCRTDAWKHILDMVAANWVAEDDPLAGAGKKLPEKNRNWLSSIFG